METIHVKLLKKEGRTVGHAISRSGKFDGASTPLPEDENLAALPSIDERIGSHAKNFVASVIVYLDYAPFILMVVPSLSSDAVIASITKFLEINARQSFKESDGDVFEIPINSFSEFAKLTDHLEPAFDVQKTFAKNMLLGLVASLDNFLGSLIKEILMHFSGTADFSEKLISVREIFSYADFNELREHIIQSESEAISYKGFGEQIDWITKKLKIEPLSKYEDWPKINEIVQRRNLFAHTNGVVTRQYIKNSEQFGYDVNGMSIGKSIGVDHKYFKASIKCILEFGIMLAFVVRKKISPKGTKLPDEDLNQTGYWLIHRGEYNLARRILKFAHDARNIEEEKIKRMIAVNYANALRLCKQETESIKILESLDWTAVGPEFEICVAAVKGDVDEVVKLMPRVTKSENYSESVFREWPVFLHVRDDSKFTSAYENIFGVPYRQSRRKRDAIADVFSLLVEEKKSGRAEVIDVTSSLGAKKEESSAKVLEMDFSKKARVVKKPKSKPKK